MKVATVAKLTASIFLSLCISGCGPDDKKDEQADAKTPIKMWVAPNENEEAFWNKMVTEWNKDPGHTPVEFTTIPAANSSEEAIMNALASGTEPDISSNIFSFHCAERANACHKRTSIKLSQPKSTKKYIYEIGFAGAKILKRDLEPAITS